MTLAPTRNAQGQFVRASFEERLWGNVDATGDCWEWKGAIQTDGYGRIAPKGTKYKMAHRAVYELLVGEIPEGLTLDHLCRNRACVNPDYLEPVDLNTNLKRSPEQITTANAAKTHCLRGHKFTPDNTYTPPKRPNRRHCKACQTERSLSSL